jgi:hypothetical protein
MFVCIGVAETVRMVSPWKQTTQVQRSLDYLRNPSQRQIVFGCCQLGMPYGRRSSSIKKRRLSPL